MNQDNVVPSRPKKIHTPQDREARTPKGLAPRARNSCITPRPVVPPSYSVSPRDLPDDDLQQPNGVDECENDQMQGQISKPAEVLFIALRNEFERLQKEIDNLQKENKGLQGGLEHPVRPSHENTAKLTHKTCLFEALENGETTSNGFAQKDDFFQPPEVMSQSSDDFMRMRRSLGGAQSQSQEFGRTHEPDSFCVGTTSSQPADYTYTRPSYATHDAMSLLFSRNEGTKKSRAEKISKLHSWFDRLVSPGEEGIPATQLLRILEDVHGPKAMLLKVHEIEDVIRLFHTKHATQLKTDADADGEDIEGGYFGRDQSMDISSIGGNDIVMLFPTFADIILFDRTEDVAEPAYANAVIVRDALMRSHIDDLVVHYARIPPPRSVSLEERRTKYIIGLLDPIVAIVILINGLTIGISSDVKWDGWDLLEVVFTIFFLTEILLKLSLIGFRRHFCGPDWSWNWFDAVVVLLAVIDLPLSLIASSDDTNLNDFSLVRMARLARLTRMLRLLRILRLRIFKELLLMVKGVVAGLRTLFWAIVMLLAIVYACAVMLRQTVGQDHHVMSDQYHTVLFGSVAWSMFSAFRCFMSDCTLPDGTPISGHMYALYGYSYVVPFSLMTMFITFGIFNMVTAVFVENVMESARQRQMLSKENEQRRVAELMRNLVLALAAKRHLGGSGSWLWNSENPAPDQSLATWSSWFKAVHDFCRSPAARLAAFVVNKEARTRWRASVCDVKLNSEITRETFMAAIEDPQVSRLIDNLEVNVADRSELFDVLDSDGSGCIDIGELISGIMKMRSSETKQNIVALILGMRGIRDTLRDTNLRVLQIQQVFSRDGRSPSGDRRMSARRTSHCQRVSRQSMSTKSITVS